jgi:hypothetical protein
MATVGIRDSQHPTQKVHPGDHKALLTLGIRIFTPESVFILKDTHGVGEIDAMPAEILCCFFWVLFVIHHALYI